MPHSYSHSHKHFAPKQFGWCNCVSVCTFDTHTDDSSKHMYVFRIMVSKHGNTHHACGVVHTHRIHNKSHLLLLPQCIATYRAAHSNKQKHWHFSTRIGLSVVRYMLCACMVLMCIRHTHVTIVRYFFFFFFFSSVWQNVAPLCCHSMHTLHIHTNEQTNKQWN